MEVIATNLFNGLHEKRCLWHNRHQKHHMYNYAILQSLLQNSQRNLSMNQIRQFANLSKRQAYKAQKEFCLPLERIISMSQQEPVRLILDYVLISRDMQTLTYPFNYVLNTNTYQLKPTLFVLFILAEVKGKFYPVFLDFWAQEEWEQSDAIYVSKFDVAKSALFEVYEKGLEISEVLFDAGFCSKTFLDELQDFEIPYICRFPRNRKVWLNPLVGKKAAQIFRNNRQFYYDRHRKCYVSDCVGQYGNHDAKLVAVANRRHKLDERKYYCLLTNQTELTGAQVLKRYTGRGRIEWFFKIMKSYLGLEAFYRHNPDSSLIPNFNMRAAAFVLVQDFALDMEQTIPQALVQLRKMSSLEAEMALKRYWHNWSESIVKTTTEPFERMKIQEVA